MPPPKRMSWHAGGWMLSDRSLWASSPAIAVVLFLVVLTAPDSHAGSIQLVSTQRVWDAAPHNAFTDLVRFNGVWYCSFREAAEHAVTVPGSARVLRSTDGQTWTSACLMTSPAEDFRDPHLTITPDNRLMLYVASATPAPINGVTHRNYAWFSQDGTRWTDRVEIGEPNIWLWRITWHQGTAYGIGYYWYGKPFIRLYTGTDGIHFNTLVADMGAPIEANETTRLLFMDDGRAYVLAREGAWGTAMPPYTQWTWQTLGFVPGGPEALRLPDGRFIVASRLSDGAARTSLSWGDPVAGTLTECLTLPSGGDTSYPGLVWYDNMLWISYHSSHEGRTSIYLAKVVFSEDDIDNVQDLFNRSDSDMLGTTQTAMIPWSERATLGPAADVARIVGGQLQVFGAEGFDPAASGPGAAVLAVDMPSLTIEADMRFSLDQPSQAAGKNTGGFILRRPRLDAGVADPTAARQITVQFHPSGGLFIGQNTADGRSVTTLFADNPFVAGQDTMEDINRFRGAGSLPKTFGGRAFDTDGDGVLETGEAFQLRAVLAGRSLEVFVNGVSIAAIAVEGDSGVPSNYVSLFKNRWTGNAADAPCHVFFDNLQIGRIGGKAKSPSPATGARDVERTTRLGWSAGPGATLHNVYFGEGGPDSFVGSTATASIDPGTLHHSTTYYWRVDEISTAGTTVGNVWTFTTKPAPGDFDQDGDVDLSDFGFFQLCLSGSGIRLRPGCEPADLTGNGDVDGADFALFRACFTGTDLQPGC